MHTDIKSLVVRNLTRRLYGMHLRQRLGLFDDAAAERGEQRDPADQPSRSHAHTSPLSYVLCALRASGPLKVHYPCALFLYSMYSFHSFSLSSGSVSCSAALRKRRATTSSSLPSGISVAAAPLPPAPALVLPLSDLRSPLRAVL